VLHPQVNIIRETSDWYLRLAGEITRMFHGEIPADPKLPEQPWKEPARR